MRRKRQIVPHPTDPTAALVPLTRGYFAVISAVDTAAVGVHSWQVRAGHRTFYAASGNLQLHRLIADLSGLQCDLEVDHRDGNGLDCRRSNLRSATEAQNKANAPISRRNSTGAKGVSRFGNKFRARVTVEGETHDLGVFDTVAEASAAAMAARVQLHGEFANHGFNHAGHCPPADRRIPRLDN